MQQNQSSSKLFAGENREGLGFLRVAGLGGGGGGGGVGVPTVHNSKTINDNETKLGGVVRES